MTNDPWYEAVDANTKLTQGDIILDCPVVRWASQPLKLETGKEVETLKSAVEVIRADVVVMTQACDLENNKVENVILCPHLSLDGYKEEWENFMKERGAISNSRSRYGVEAWLLLSKLERSSNETRLSLIPEQSQLLEMTTAPGTSFVSTHNSA